MRYLGGDETLVDEILTNQRAQERLAQAEPKHPARVSEIAVPQTCAYHQVRRTADLNIDAARLVRVDDPLLFHSVFGR